MMSNLEPKSRPTATSNNNGMTEKEEDDDDDDDDDDTRCCRRQSNSHHHQEKTAIVPYYFHQAYPLYRLLLLPYFMEAEVWKQPPPQQKTNDLLRDLLPTILSYADAQTLSRCSQVCYQWKILSQQELHWENLCRNTFQVSSSQLRPKPHPKELYILIHQQWKHLYQSATSRDPLRGTNLTALPPAISITLMQ